jgi:hypothetical protein
MACVIIARVELRQLIPIEKQQQFPKMGLQKSVPGPI